jgi:hypothetical protein
MDGFSHNTALAKAVITLGRGCLEDESEDEYAERCGLAARRLCLCDRGALAEVIRNMAAAGEQLFVADALIRCAQVKSRFVAMTVQ